MRVAQPVAVWLFMLAVSGVLTGCGTLEPELQMGEYSPAIEPLDEGQDLLSEVLANYARGMLYDLDNQYAAALTNYFRAVELDPANEELNVRIAMGLLQQKRTEEAIAMVEALATRKPDSASAQAWLALVYRASDQTDQAIAAYQCLIDIDPAKPGPYLELAGYYLHLGQKDQTIDTLKLGIKRVGEPVELYRSLAKLYIDEVAQAPESDGAGATRRLAIDLLEKAVKLAPDEVNLRLQLGDLLIREGQPGRAIRQFQAIEEQYPEDLGIKRRLAMSFFAAGDTGDAIDRLEALAAADPTRGQIYYYLGELYLEEGNRDAATLNFTLAATASPQTPAPFIRLASIQMQDNAATAIETLHKALEQMPGNPRLTELLGHAYLANDQYDLAREWLQKAESRLGEEARGRIAYRIAIACYLGGNEADTLTYVARAMDEDTRYLQAFVRDVLQHTDADLDAAIDLFQQLADRTGDEPAVFLYLGMIKSSAERYQEAIEDFARAAALAAENRRNTQIIDTDFFFSYAAAHERLGHDEQAEDLFGKALELDARNSNAHNYLAYMWAERGERLDEALEHVRIALEVSPDSGAFLDTLGWIYYQQGNYEDALRELQRALELTPGDPTVIEHLGDTLNRLERPEEAIAQWTASFLLDPESESVAGKLAERGIDLEPLREQARLLAAEPPAGTAPASAPVVGSLDDEGIPEPALTPLDQTTRDPAPEDVEKRLQDLGVPLAPTNPPAPVIEIAPEERLELSPGAPLAPPADR